MFATGSILSASYATVSLYTQYDSVFKVLNKGQIAGRFTGQTRTMPGVFGPLCQVEHDTSYNPEYLPVTLLWIAEYEATAVGVSNGPGSQMPSPSDGNNTPPTGSGTTAQPGQQPQQPAGTTPQKPTATPPPILVGKGQTYPEPPMPWNPLTPTQKPVGTTKNQTWLDKVKLWQALITIVLVVVGLAALFGGGKDSPEN